MPALPKDASPEDIAKANEELSKKSQAPAPNNPFDDNNDEIPVPKKKAPVEINDTRFGKPNP